LGAFGWGSKLQDVNLGEPKKRTLGKRLVPFAEIFMGLKNTSKESLCEQLGWVLETKFFGNQMIRVGSLLLVDSKVGNIIGKHLRWVKFMGRDWKIGRN